MMENHYVESSNDVSPRLRPRRKSLSQTPPDVFRSPAGIELSLSARKRKRKEQDEDTLSIQSFDISYKESTGKRLRKSLSRVASLANIFSPVNVKPVGRKIGQSLQRSLSFKNILSPAKTINTSSTTTTTSYKKPQPTPTKRRPSKLWQETVDGNVTNVFSEMQIKRQNAIYELYQGEDDLVHDLQMVKETYYNSMKTLGLMKDSELNQIFSVIETLVPLHEELVQNMIRQRQPDGSTDKIGEILLDWLPNLRCYIPYCANQVYAKTLLDEKKNDKRLQDFLQRCQESPFSRKLDLWTFLDVPRNRLVKYPLLLKNIQKRTPEKHTDIEQLEEAIELVEDIIREVDRKTGEAKSRFIAERLDYLEDRQRHPYIEESKALLCDGVLRNSRGTKLTVFLFKEVMVLTRPTHRQERQCYQVYRYPLPLYDLTVEDLKDGEVKMGSFRNMLGQGQGSKHVFRVNSISQTGKGYTHTLQARDEHDKKQWLTCLQTAIKEARPLPESHPYNQEGCNSGVVGPADLDETIMPNPAEDANCTVVEEKEDTVSLSDTDTVSSACNTDAEDSPDKPQSEESPVNTDKEDDAKKK